MTLRRGVRGTLPQPLRKPWPKKRNGACVFARTNARTMAINAKRHRLREPIERHRARKPTQLMGVASPKITGLPGNQSRNHGHERQATPGANANRAPPGVPVPLTLMAVASPQIVGSPDK